MVVQASAAILLRLLLLDSMVSWIRLGSWHCEGGWMENTFCFVSSFPNSQYSLKSLPVNLQNLHMAPGVDMNDVESDVYVNLSRVMS